MPRMKKAPERSQNPSYLPNLVKAAIFGKDANWGRIICAAGYAGVDFDPSLVDIYLKSANGSILVAPKWRWIGIQRRRGLGYPQRRECFLLWWT